MTHILKVYRKASKNISSCRSNGLYCNSITSLLRCYCDKSINKQDFADTTILIENGYSFQELPVIVRKLTDFNKIEHMMTNVVSDIKREYKSNNYTLIQEEFTKCRELREVFALLTKCTKITPTIALCALQRIKDLEQPADRINTNDPNSFIYFARNAILDKLQKVIADTDDTQTILNILNTNLLCTLNDKFSHELTLRAIDSQLTLEQLCDFTIFLINNNNDQKYCETLDRLWVGFFAKEHHINEDNIVQLFNVVPGLKTSKRTLLNLLEQKLSQIWDKIKAPDVQNILNVLIVEKYFSPKSLPIFGHWLYMNIHALDEDTLLDIVSKFTCLRYYDHQIVAAIEKYMKLRGSKISSYVLIAGIYNFCTQFRLCNKQILNVCSEYFITNRHKFPSSFLKCCIYPHGYLNSEPVSLNYWVLVEDLILDRFEKLTVNRINNLCDIILAYVYLGRHPLKLIKHIFHPEVLAKIKNPEIYKKLQLIDTALSLECKEIVGPMLPKDQCYSPITQDIRIKKILLEIKDNLVNIIGNPDMLSIAVSIPNYCSDSTYLIDAMIHPPGFNINIFNWKMKTDKVTAIVIHLPDHFASDGKTLLGSQVMRLRHMKILGLKVISFNYNVVCQLHVSSNKSLLEAYMLERINSEESDNMKDV